MTEHVRKAFDFETWRVIAVAFISSSGSLAIVHVALSIVATALTCLWLAIKIRRAFRDDDHDRHED